MLGRAGMVPLLAVCGGCPIERIHQDATAGLDYLRLKSATQVDADSRWQISPETRIAVSEIAPASRADWLTAARKCMGSIFALQTSDAATPRTPTLTC